MVVILREEVKRSELYKRSVQIRKSSNSQTKPGNFFYSCPAPFMLAKHTVTSQCVML